MIENGVKVFSLPAEEMLLSSLMNDDMVEITNKVITPCPKEGIILYLVEYKKHI